MLNQTEQITKLTASLKTGSTHFLAGNEGLLNHFSNLVFKELLVEIIADDGNWDSDTMEFLTEVQEATELDNLDATDVISYLDAIGLDYTDLALLLTDKIDDLSETCPNPGS